MKSQGEQSATSPGARPEGTADAASASIAVQQMFDSIAPKYDRLNHILSFGFDRVWWNRAARAFDDVLQKPESHVLDLCCGTADMTSALLARRPSESAAPITAIDFSHEMIERGRAKLSGKAVNFIEADALALPLADASQDLVVSAFGFRNLADYDAGLREIRRVLPAGGSVGILDFSEPPGLLGTVYRLYFRHVLPRIGGIVSGSGSSYQYLPASVERFPPPAQMCSMMENAGFIDARWRPYLFGVAGLWSATAV